MIAGSKNKMKDHKDNDDGMEKEKNKKKGLEKGLRGTDDLISRVDEKQWIVLDIGTYYTKVGFSGNDNPTLVVPTCIASPAKQAENDFTTTKLFNKYGYSALDQVKNPTDDYSLHFPINRSYISDIKEDKHKLENFIKDLLENQLKCEIANEDILIIDNPCHSKEYRNTLAKLFFDQLNVHSINFMNSGILSLFAAGKTEGLAIELSHSRTSVVPVYGGYMLSHAMHSVPVGGKDSTAFMQDRLTALIEEQGLKLDAIHQENEHLLMKIKEKLSFVPMDYELELMEEDENDLELKAFVLPDGEHIIEVDQETRCNSGELLLRPELANIRETGLIDNIIDSLTRCDDQLRQSLFSKIVLCGGSSMTRGMPERILRDLKTHTARNFNNPNYNLISPENRHLTSWIGGSMLASIKTFQDLSIKRGEYDENEDARMHLINRRTL